MTGSNRTTKTTSMTSTSSRWIEDLSKYQVEKLTQLLCNPDGRITYDWLEEQEHAIKQRLPPSLKRPQTLAGRIYNKFARDKAVLCDRHRKLNSQLIRHIFSKLTEECTYRLRHFNDISDTLETSIEEWRQRMVALNSMWTERDTFRELFNVKRGDPHYTHVSSGCEACILAKVGGNLRILMDLYIAMSSRRNQKHYGDFMYPPMHRLLESWLDQEGNLENFFHASYDFTAHVRNVRKSEQKRRKALDAAGLPHNAKLHHDDPRGRSQGSKSLYTNEEKRAPPSPATSKSTTSSPRDTSRRLDAAEVRVGSSTLSPPKANTGQKRSLNHSRPSTSDDSYTDAEHENATEEIVDFYAKRLSRTFGVNKKDSRNSLHPMYADAITFDAKTGRYAAIPEDQEVVSPVSPIRDDFEPREQDYVNGWATPPAASGQVSPVNELDVDALTKHNTNMNRYSGSIYTTPSPPRSQPQPEAEDSGYDTQPFISSPSAFEFEAAHRAGTEQKQMARDTAAERAEAYRKLVGEPKPTSSSQASKTTLKYAFVESDSEDDIPSSSHRRTTTQASRRPANTQQDPSRGYGYEANAYSTTIANTSEEVVFRPPQVIGNDGRGTADSVATEGTAVTTWEDFCEVVEPERRYTGQRGEVVRRCEARGWGQEERQDKVSGKGKGKEEKGGMFGMIKRRLRE